MRVLQVAFPTLCLTLVPGAENYPPPLENYTPADFARRGDHNISDCLDFYQIRGKPGRMRNDLFSSHPQFFKLIVN